MYSRLRSAAIRYGRGLQILSVGCWVFFQHTVDLYVTVDKISSVLHAFTADIPAVNASFEVLVYGAFQTVGHIEEFRLLDIVLSYNHCKYYDEMKTEEKEVLSYQFNQSGEKCRFWSETTLPINDIIGHA